MIDFLPFLKVAPLLAVGLVSPGPDFMLISNLSLSRGRYIGIQGAAGIATGIMIYTALSLWGLGLLFAKMLWLAIAIKVLGGLYLCYLGIMLWRSTIAKSVAAPPTSVELPTRAGKNAYGMGLLTSLTNPKAMAFFASIFALALTPDTNMPTKIVTMLLCTLLAFGWFGFVAVALSTPRIRRRYQRWSKAIDRFAGSILMLFGLKLVLSGR